jgi:hypothetical protein
VANRAKDAEEVIQTVGSTNRKKSGNICDALDRGLNEKGFRRETDEQKKTSNNHRNCGGGSGACSRV